MLHHTIVVGSPVTPTSLFASWVYSIGSSQCSTLVQNRALSSPRGTYSRCTVSAFRMCKGPKTCESLTPIHGNCNTRPIWFISCAAWVNRSPKPTLSYPPPGVWRKGSERSGFLWINLWLIWSSFRRKKGGMGAAYGRYGKSGGSSHRRSTNTLHPLPDPYPLKTIP